MSRTLSTATTAALAFTVTRPGYLVEINGALRYSSFGAVTWNSLSWGDNDVRVRLSRADGTASSDVTVTLGNGGQALTAILLSANYTGTALKVWKAYRGALAVADPVLVFDGVVSDSQITPEWATLTGTSERMEWSACPRLRINKATGFNALLPAGTRLTIGTQTLVIDR